MKNERYNGNIKSDLELVYDSFFNKHEDIIKIRKNLGKSKLEFIIDNLSILYKINLLGKKWAIRKINDITSSYFIRIREEHLKEWDRKNSKDCKRYLEHLKQKYGSVENYIKTLPGDFKLVGEK